MKLLSKEKLILNQESIYYILLLSVGILVPLFLKGPQLLVGILVNFVLAFGVLRYDVKRVLPVAILPSVITLSNNVLFGGATSLLIFLIPIIILSNLVYISLIKYQKINLFSVLISSGSKTLILFLFAFVLVNSFGLPRLFLSSMGYMQLITSAIGGILAFFLNKKII